MISVQTADFDIGAEQERLVAGQAGIGAVCAFTGLVRDFSPAAGGKLQFMTLEHYPGMTEKQLERIDAAARAQWDVIATRIIHRTGRLGPGERIVLVMVAAAHRGDAFAAASFIMDALKTSAPFWKKEHGPDGGSWVEARENDRGDTGTK